MKPARRSLSLYIIMLCVCLKGFAQAKTDPQLESILTAATQRVLNEVITNPDKFRCQVIYTQINRDRQNRPTLHNFYFHYDPEVYFNPASTVKLPLAFLSLEKLNDMKVKEVNKFSFIQFDSSYAGQSKACEDSTSDSGLPSIAHYIRKAFLISDNDAYNRMYEFVGQQTINRSLHQKGYTGTRITRQFMGFTDDQNRHTNPVRFISSNGTVIYRQPPAYNSDSFHFPAKVLIGNAHYNRNDSLVNLPFDFTEHNNVPLEDLQQMLQSVLFPSSVPATKRFRLTEDDRKFLMQYLSQFPSETNYPKYDDAAFYDNYVKFYFRDSTHHLPEGIRVFNKVGWAYGFMTDVSYIVDFKNKVEFMLSAAIYVNSDGILNDNKYDYNSIGYPFFYQLGQVIYHYELNRKRKYFPDLSAFKISYEKRNNDMRASIKEAEN